MSDGPATALLIALIGLVIVLVATAGLLVSKRRGVTLEQAPTPEAPEVADEPVVAEPAVVEPTVIQPVEAPPLAEAVPPTEVATDAPVVVEAVVAPKRGRVRSIGTSLARLFKGSTLTPEDWEELEEVLLRADVGVKATDAIVTALRKRNDVTDGLEALRAELLGVLGDVDRSMHRKADGLTVWMVTGVNGVGKTTTIGKLASHLRAEGVAVVLAAADTFRAAADTQLERWAEASGASIVKHKPGGDPAAVAFDGVAAAKARGAGVLIVDTAGRLQTKQNLMDELGKIRRVLEREAGPPDEVLLVLDATTGQNGVAQARAFAEVAGITGLALTKLDGTAKGGIVIAVQQELGIPVKLVGMGEGIDDLAVFDPEGFVGELLET